MRHRLCFVVTLLIAAPIALANERIITGTVRDFKGAFTSTSPFTAVEGGHPHFEIFTFTSVFAPFRAPPTNTTSDLLALNTQIGMVEPGIVASQIGADRKPVWLGGTPTPGIAFPTTRANYNAGRTNLVQEPDDEVSRALFNQWFNDTPGVNMSAPLSLTLTDTNGDGVFTFESNAFFPIDDQLFGNEGRAHNFHFTFEFHDTFTYQPGQTFQFRGDDDVWVFINDQLVVDLGGLHNPPQTALVDLDTLGLTPGENYTFDFFFAERNTSASFFRIDTTLELGIPEPGSATLGLAAVAAMALRRRRA